MSNIITQSWYFQFLKQVWHVYFYEFKGYIYIHNHIFIKPILRIKVLKMHLKIISYRIVSHGEAGCSCIGIATHYVFHDSRCAYLRHIVRIFNHSESSSMSFFYKMLLACIECEFFFYVFLSLQLRDFCEASYNLHIECLLSGHERTSLDDGVAHARDFAYILSLYSGWEYRARAGKYVYPCHDSGGDPRIDTNVRNIIRDARKKELY